MLEVCLFCTHETVESENTLLKANGACSIEQKFKSNRKTLLKSYGGLFIQYTECFNRL